MRSISYLSTRGSARAAGFTEALLEGLAPDGGLYVPDRLPDARHRLDAWTKLSYGDLAFEVMRPFVDLEDAELRDSLDRAYASFDAPDVVRLEPLQDSLFLLELFHGPTLAFKDIALQWLGQLFDLALKKTDRCLNILAATSGDTGSAAIHAVRGKSRVRIVVLHPRGRVSALQERQMTSVLDPGVFNLAVGGSFDDCQRIVKDLFRDLPFKQAHSLGAVNSVNWARILAQIVYYFYAGLRVLRETGSREVSFAVPTGNFGDILAGYYAAKMGLPVRRLILATNENDILARFFQTGRYEIGSVQATLSPSMDIQVASNFERYLLDRFPGAAALRDAMILFERTGKLDHEPFSADPLFAAERADTETTLDTIRHVFDRCGKALDPHSAVGVAAAIRRVEPNVPCVCLATAHPAKFPDAVARALGRRDLARHLALDALANAPTRSFGLPADAAAIRQFIETRLRSAIREGENTHAN